MTHRVLQLPRLLTPDAFRAAFPGPGTFVFEDGDLCLMGAAPAAVLRASRQDAPFARLRDFLAGAGAPMKGAPALAKKAMNDAARRATFDPSFPFPFRAGLVGYIGYECGQALERLPNLPRPRLDVPDLYFALHRWVIGTRDGKSWLSTLDDGMPGLDPIVGVPGGEPQRRASPTPPRPHLSEADYLARVAASREHILDGDAFEICLTNAFDVPFDRARAWPLFRALRAKNPAPFAAFLELDEAAIVSSSPERFLSLDAARIAETRPIKGTRARSSDATEDARLREELRSSEKDRAENAMIVDLARNDLGRVCKVGSVVAPDLYAVESYATVHQLVSTVRGELAPDHDVVDLLAACFPPGSMTGAPKIEAMRILEHLEPVERGPYAGALGWIDLDGTMDFSVVIRTAIVGANPHSPRGTARFNAGGAVTADSEPASEYEEMLQKTRALRDALDAVTREHAVNGAHGSP